MSKSKHIYLPSEVKREIEKTFKVSRVTLWNALQFIHYSPQAKMLRAAAIQRGGVVYDPSSPYSGDRPDCLTTFDTADDTMIQKFGDRVLVISDLETGDVTTYVDGAQVNRRGDVTLTQLKAILRQAQLKANELK